MQRPAAAPVVFRDEVIGRATALPGALRAARRELDRRGVPWERIRIRKLPHPEGHGRVWMIIDLRSAGAFDG